MKKDSESLVQTHLNRITGILKATSPTPATLEKRIAQNFVEKVQKQLEIGEPNVAASADSLSEDSFEKVSYYIDLTLKTFYKISSPHLDKEHQAKFIFVLSETYETLGNYQAALTHYARAGELAAQDENMALSGQIQYRMARIYSEMGKWIEAAELLNQAQINLQNAGDFSGVALTKLEIAKIAYRKGEYLKAENLFQSALQASELVNDVANSAFINNHLGVILRMQGKYEEAFQYFQKALIDFQSIQHKPGTAESFNNLGVVHLRKNELRTAIGYFEKAMGICQETGNLPLMAFVYLNRAEFYSEVGDYPMATTACGKALEILIRLKNPIGIAKTNTLLGRIFWRSGDAETARYFYQESMQLYQEFWIPLGLANATREFGNMLQELGRMDEAQKMFDRAESLYKKLKIDQNPEDEADREKETIEVKTENRIAEKQ